MLRDFSAAAEQADWAVVYFAGHGLEINRQNYLIPVDARLKSDRDVPYEAISLEQVVSSVEGARKLRLVVIDACRDNPFAQQMTRTSSMRSIGRGLSRVDPDGGTLVAYAAREGQVAMDGDQGNSPFVLALNEAISTPGLEINMVFRQVRDEVLAMTGRRQEPFLYGSLPREAFYFVPPVQRDEQDRLWGNLEAGRDPEAIERFLSRFPDTVHKSKAIARIAELRAEQLVLDLQRRYGAGSALPASGSGSQAAGGSPGTQAPVPAQPTVPAAPDLVAWERVAESSDPVELRRFVSTFPQSRYVPQARRLLELLQIAADKAEQEKIKKAEELALQAAREVEERRKALVAAEQARRSEEERRQRERDQALADQRRRDLEAEQQRLAEQAARLADAARRQRELEERQARLERERLEKEQQSLKLTALQDGYPSKPSTPATDPPQSAANLARDIQVELRRLGCFVSAPQGVWTREAREALSSFNRAAKLQLATAQASEGALWSLRQWKQIGCVPACPAGTALSEGTCVPERRKPATRARAEAPAPKAEPKPVPETKRCAVTRFANGNFVCAD